MKLESLKMNLQSLKSHVKNEKDSKIKGKSTKIAAAFIKNKANFKNIKIGLSSFETSKYEILPAWRGEKANPNKPNSNPITKRPKMNSSSIITMNYRHFPRSPGKKQTQYKANFILDVSSLGFLSGDKAKTNLSSNVAVGDPILSVPNLSKDTQPALSLVEVSNGPVSKFIFQKCSICVLLSQTISIYKWIKKMTIHRRQFIKQTLAGGALFFCSGSNNAFAKVSNKLPTCKIRTLTSGRIIVEIEMKSLYYWTCGEQEYFSEVYMGNPS